jgi:hypothetical protein
MILYEEYSNMEKEVEALCITINENHPKLDEK